MAADEHPFGRGLFGQEHVRVYRETDGAQGYHWRGTTILLLTTRGRASGVPRTTPLIYRDSWVVVASQGGAPDHPDWYKNLQAGPEVEIQVKDERTAVRRTLPKAQNEPGCGSG